MDLRQVLPAYETTEWLTGVALGEIMALSNDRLPVFQKKAPALGLKSTWKSGGFVSKGFWEAA